MQKANSRARMTYKFLELKDLLFTKRLTSLEAGRTMPHRVFSDSSAFGRQPVALVQAPKANLNRNSGGMSHEEKS